MKPLCIDLFCGLGGWAEGFIAEGWDVIGFDIERHVYGDLHYPGQLVLQDVLTLHGSQFKNAAIIVASPPCQAYSYRAMPWKRAKALPPPDNTLFLECFRIQREASKVAGRHIPLIVENVLGAQKWIGRACWHFGSFYLWGDVPALMPTGRAFKCGDGNLFRARQSPSPHLINHWEFGIKISSPGHYRKPGSGPDWFDFGPAAYSSHSVSRRAASAMIAKIPLRLARHIARVYKPTVIEVSP